MIWEIYQPTIKIRDTLNGQRVEVTNAKIVITIEYERGKWEVWNISTGEDIIGRYRTRAKAIGTAITEIVGIMAQEANEKDNILIEE